MIRTNTQGMSGFEFLEIQYHQPNDVPLKLTRGQWEYCLDHWARRYMTGGMWTVKYPQTWLERLLHIPAKQETFDPDVDPRELAGLRHEQEAKQALLCNGQYRKVIIQD